jgi:hypothetical protein
MSDFTVEIHTQEGNIYPVQVAPDTQVEELFHDIIDYLSLPRRDAEGETISWSLYNKETGKVLQEGRTVEECGVRDGHQLKLQRKTVAGIALDSVMHFDFGWMYVDRT